jgi:hypothetical protein
LSQTVFPAQPLKIDDPKPKVNPLLIRFTQIVHTIRPISTKKLPD